jgi:hypothetical protein
MQNAEKPKKLNKNRIQKSCLIKFMVILRFGVFLLNTNTAKATQKNYAIKC